MKLTNYFVSDYYNLLLELDIEKQLTKDGSEYRLDESKPITIPLENLSFGNKELNSPFIINAVFTLDEMATAYLFSIVDKNENVILALSVTLIREDATRVTLESNSLENKHVAFIYSDVLTESTKFLMQVNKDEVSFYVNCDFYSSEEGGLIKKVELPNDAKLHLGHSGRGERFFKVR